MEIVSSAIVSSAGSRFGW